MIDLHMGPVALGLCALVLACSSPRPDRGPAAGVGGAVVGAVVASVRSAAPQEAPLSAAPRARVGLEALASREAGV